MCYDNVFPENDVFGLKAKACFIWEEGRLLLLFVWFHVLHEAFGCVRIILEMSQTLFLNVISFVTNPRRHT